MAPTNIWIAASDNNEAFVRKAIADGKHTPNDKDPNGYTPLHAAASYGHIDLLKYLLGAGGNVNIADNDGDTLLHVTEDLETAKVLVEEYKADWKAKNSDGQTPLAKLEDDEEFPELIAYFRSLLGSTIVTDPEPTSQTLNTDTGAASSATTASSLIDTLFGNPDVHLSYESMPDNEAAAATDVPGQALISEEQRKEIETIINGENAEEELTKFMTKLVEKNLRAQQQAEADSGPNREKKQRTE